MDLRQDELKEQEVYSSISIKETKSRGADAAEASKNVADGTNESTKNQKFDEKDKHEQYLISQLRNGLTWGKDGQQIKSIIQKRNGALHEKDRETSLLPFMLASSTELASSSFRSCNEIKTLMIQLKLKKDEAREFAACGYGIEHPVACNVIGWCEICQDELDHVVVLKEEVKDLQKEVDRDLDLLTTTYELLRCDPSLVWN